MLRRILLVLLALLSFGGQIFAAGYEFEGIGLREVSRGGAAIASVDDWTAIYWNPARLIMNDKPQLAGEFWGGWSNAYDGNSLVSLLGQTFSKKTLNSTAYLGAWGAVLPLKDRKIAFGTGMYTPLLQGVKFEDVSLAGTKVEVDSFGGIIVGNISLGMELSPSVSLGIGMNVVRGNTKSKIKMDNGFSSYWNGNGLSNEGILGLNWKISPKLSGGAVYRSGAVIPIETQANASFGVEEKSDLRFNFVYPPTAGIGVSYQANPQWLLSLDLNRTWWKKFKSAIDFTQAGLLLQDRQNTFNWKDTSKLRLGSGFQWTEKTQLLLGYSFDQYAIDSGSIDFSTAIDVNMNRFSAGVNYLLTENVGLGLGLVYGQGKRTENYSGQEVLYKLSGGQVMTEIQYNF